MAKAIEELPYEQAVVTLSERLGVETATALGTILARAEERIRRESDERFERRMDALERRMDKFEQRVTWILSVGLALVTILVTGGLGLVALR